MPAGNKPFDEFDQFDNQTGDYDGLNDIPQDYKSTIGYFIIIFSSLEHSLNLTIADMMSDKSHDLGYRVVGSLVTSKKIDFVHNILLNFISETDQDKKDVLADITGRLRSVNTFRNKLVHANWTTLKEDGTVRTKAGADSSEGYVTFEYVKMTPEIIQEKIDVCDTLIVEITDFFIDIKNTALDKAKKAII